jgi:hypothetical protein
MILIGSISHNIKDEEKKKKRNCKVQALLKEKNPITHLFE